MLFPSLRNTASSSPPAPHSPHGSATPRRRRPLALALRPLAAAALTLTAVATLASPAAARTTTCSGAAGDAFFNEPAGAGSAPGTVLSCRRATMKFGNNLPAHDAWQIIYASRDLNGRPMAVAGTVIVPRAAWTGSTPRPLAALAPGSQGLANKCGFSRQIASTNVFEAGEMKSFLKAGFAIATTDYQGYLNGQTPTYIVGPPEGRAVLDAARAAADLAPTGVSASAPVGLVGYSQGGQGSLWGAELARSYAPELNIVGAVAGGTPGDLLTTARYLNGGLAAGFLLDAIVGLHTAYPSLPYDSLINDAGVKAVEKLKTQCFQETLLTNVGKRLEQYTVGGIGIDELLTKSDSSGMTWKDALDESTLGKGIDPTVVPFPVFMYRGAIDEIIPTSTQDATRRAYCDAGIAVRWKVYWADHLISLFLSEPDVTSYLRDRFNGKPATSNC